MTNRNAPLQKPPLYIIKNSITMSDDFFSQLVQFTVFYFLFERHFVTKNEKLNCSKSQYDFAVKVSRFYLSIYL